MSLITKKIHFILFVLYFLPLAVWAGGPIYLTESGEASVWDNSEAIPYHPESGSCGPFSNSEML